MKTIKLSVKNFWVKYWIFVTGKEACLPSNTCNFKRDLMLFTLLNILFFPLVLFLQIFLLFISIERSPGKVGLIVTSCMQGLAYSFAGLTKGSFLANLLEITLDIILIMFSMALLLWISTIIARYVDNRPEKKYTEPKEPAFIKVLYLSWKEKLCSKIEYEP